MNAVAALVRGLGLTSGGSPVPVVVLETPGVRPGLDAVPVFVIAPDRAKPARRLFGRTFWVPYGGTVTLVDNGNLDPVTNLGDHATWRDAVAAGLRDPAGLGLGFVALAEVDNAALADPALARAGYAATAVGWAYTAQEDR